MIKKLLTILIANFALLAINGFAQTSVTLPNHLNINPANPTQPFPAEIQQLFTISADAPSPGCQKTQPYMLTMFIYRNAVDNKFVAVYRPVQGKDTCWVHLISNSNELKPDFKAGGWDKPQQGANTWCKGSGLLDTNLCPITL